MIRHPVSAQTILRPGRNCWRKESARQAAFLIDGAAYFHAFRAAAAQAQQTIMILGWDFDTRIRLGGFDSIDDGLPPNLGDFLRALLARRRRLHVYVLTWDFHVIYAWEREWWPLSKLRADRRLHFQLDADHPVWASHHQKVVVIDDALAFVGGLDLAPCRWDTPDHAPGNPPRVFPDGKPCRPFHDVQLMLGGAAAAALGDLARERWLRATGRRLPPPEVHLGHAGWPDGLVPDLEDVEVAVARTEPMHNGRPEVREVEPLLLDAIRAARRHLYIETQYLTSRRIGDALLERLREPEGPEIVVVLHPSSDGWLEQHTMDVLRGRLLKRLRAADRWKRLGLFYPHIPGLGDQGISVHSKVLIVDEDLVRIGSANLSNRSMGCDTECDAAIESGGSPRIRQAIAAFRNRLLAEHLGTEPNRVAAAVEKEGSLLRGIQALCGGPRTLNVFDEEIPPEVDSWIPDAALIDPERPLDAEEVADRIVPHERKPARRQILLGASVLLALIALAAAWRWTPLRDWIDIDLLTGYAGRFKNNPAVPFIAVGAFLVGGLVAVPVTALIAVTVLTFGSWQGFLYSFLGMTASALATFGIGHLAGHETVKRLSGSRLSKISRHLARRGVLAVVAIRIIPIAPFSLVNLVAGASHIRFRDFLMGTVIGELPGLLAISIFVDQVIDAVRHPGFGSFALLGALIAAIVGGTIALRRWLAVREGES